MFYTQNMEKKRRGRPIGWHKENAKGRIKIYASTTISGLPEEIEKLKTSAKQAGKSVSRFILDSL